MKQVTSMSRLVNQLEKMFRLLNADFFDNELDTPIITVTPTAKAYAHYTPWDAWSSKEEHKREINISSGGLNRRLESICASLLHEMCHMYNDTVLNIADTSRGGMYHNKYFKHTAEQHGLIVERHPTYGYCITSPSERLYEWLIDHDELREIEICRTSPGFAAVGVGTRVADGNPTTTIYSNNSHHRRYVCPCCHTVIRATKKVNIVCADCSKEFVEM